MEINTPTVGQLGTDFSNPNSMFAGFTSTATNPYSIASQNAAGTAQQIHANPVSGVAKAGAGLLAKGSEFGSGVVKGLDAFGAKNFGLANPSLQGPTLGGGALGEASGSLGSTSFSGLLGAAGTGLTIGGWLGGGVGGQIGGALGGIAGSVLLGGLTGIGGAQLGATLGSVVPGIGTVIGAVAGSLLGGMFGGGGTPHPVSESAYQGINPDGTFRDIGYGAKHISQEVAKEGANDFQKYLQSQAKKYGIEYNTTLNGRVDYTDKIGKLAFSSTDAKDSYAASLAAKKTSDTNQLYTWKAGDEDGKATAYNDAWKYLVTSSGLDPNGLQAVHPTSANEILINKQTGPSDWDTFLANYKEQQNAQRTPTA